MSAPRRVLVTGATGFIGRHLVTELSARGYRVRAAVRNGPAPAGATEVVEIGDVGPETEWGTALAEVDVVVHLAGHAHRMGADAGDSGMFDCVNAAGTARLAEAVGRAPSVGRLILISSIAVTGSQSMAPVTERTPAAPDTPYGRSKQAAEAAVAQALGATRADWCAIRPPLVYGPGNPGNMARLLKLVRLGLPLPLGGIANRRSFLYVGNLVDLIIRTLDDRRASRRIFTVADCEAVSTSELLRLIGEVTGRPVRLFHLTGGLLRGLARAGDAVSLIARRSVGLDSYSLDRLLGSLVVDSTSVQAALDWAPPYTLEEGLRRTLVAT